MLAAALALGSSLTWGGADFFGGLISRRRTVLAVLLISQAVGLALIGSIVAVNGATVGPDLWLAAVAGLIGMAALACFYRGLAIGAMGVVAPITAAAAVIPVTVGIASGERPATIQWIGIALAIGGIVLAAREPAGASAAEAQGAAPAAAPRISRGVGLALAAAVGFGVFLTLMDRAAEPDPLLATLVTRTASVMALGTVALLMRPDLRVGARDGAALVLVGTLDTSANALYAVASTLGLLSVTAVLGSLYPVMPVVLAWVFLGERISLAQRIGSAITIGGAVLLATG